MPEFFVSIHRNSFPTPNAAEGVETLVYNDSGVKAEMARNINQQLETIGFVNHGVRVRPNLTVLRRTRMPALLVEAGFLNSDTDNQIFDENFDAIAQAIASGIIDTLEGGHTENPRQSEGTSPGSMQSGMRQSGGTQSGNTPPGSRQIDADMRGNVQTGGGQRENIGAGGVMPEESRTESDTSGRYRVQVGAFRNQAYANNLLRELKEQEYPARIEDSGGFYRVVVGSFGTLQEAAQMEQRLKWSGYPTIVIS